MRLKVKDFLSIILTQGGLLIKVLDKNSNFWRKKEWNLIDEFASWGMLSFLFQMMHWQKDAFLRFFLKINKFLMKRKSYVWNHRIWNLQNRLLLFWSFLPLLKFWKMFMFILISFSFKLSRLKSSFNLLAGRRCLSRCLFKLVLLSDELRFKHESYTRTLLFHCFRCIGGVRDNRSNNNCSENGLNSPWIGVEIGVAGSDDLERNQIKN